MSGNQYGAQFKRAGVPALDPDAAVVRYGYEDVRAGKPYRKNFDSWDTRLQANYECGRRIAACLKAHLVLPEWPDSQRLEEVLPWVPDAAAIALQQENAFTMRQKS